MRTTSPAFSAHAALFLLLGASMADVAPEHGHGCGDDQEDHGYSATAARFASADGTITAKNPSQQTITIRHGNAEPPVFKDGTDTYTYSALDAKQVGTLQVGDQIHYRIDGANRTPFVSLWEITKK